MTCAGTRLFVWSINGLAIASTDTSQLSIDGEAITALTLTTEPEWLKVCSFEWFVVPETFNDQDRVMITGHLDGAVKLWSVVLLQEASGSQWSIVPRAVLRFQQLGPITSLFVDASQTKFFSGSAFGVVVLWQPPTFGNLATTSSKSLRQYLPKSNPRIDDA